MTTNAIAGTSVIPSVNPVTYQPAKVTAPNNETTSHKTLPLASTISVANSNSSTVSKPLQTAGVVVKKEAARTMAHVVEVYNIHGKARTRFLDSHNNLIYQIPSESKAKMEDLMVKPDTSADAKV